MPVYFLSNAASTLPMGLDYNLFMGSLVNTISTRQITWDPALSITEAGWQSPLNLPNSNILIDNSVSASFNATLTVTNMNLNVDIKLSAVDNTNNVRAILFSGTTTTSTSPISLNLTNLSSNLTLNCTDWLSIRATFTSTAMTVQSATFGLDRSTSYLYFSPDINSIGCSASSRNKVTLLANK